MRSVSHRARWWCKVVLACVVLSVVSNAVVTVVALNRHGRFDSEHRLISVAELDSDVRITVIQSRHFSMYQYVTIMVDERTGIDLREMSEADLLSAIDVTMKKRQDAVVTNLGVTLPPVWVTWPPPGSEPTRVWKEGAVGWPVPGIRVRPWSSGNSFWDGPLLTPPGVSRYAPWWPGLLTNLAAHAALWLPIILVAPIAKERLTRWRSARRALRGECPSCRYQRAGLPSAAPCPECGHIPTPTSLPTTSPPPEPPPPPPPASAHAHATPSSPGPGPQ